MNTLSTKVPLSSNFRQEGRNQRTSIPFAAHKPHTFEYAEPLLRSNIRPHYLDRRSVTARYPLYGGPTAMVFSIRLKSLQNWRVLVLYVH
jgi:hypothetical protein